jgi:UDP-glucose 4-epimerase
MNILITGGSGFIGSHLTEALCFNHKVSVIDDLSTGSFSNLQPSLPYLSQFYKENCNNSSMVNKIIGENRIDWIFHLATIPSVPRSIKNPIESFDSGTLATARLIEAAIKYRVKKVIFSSSASVYGNQTTEQKINEQTLLNPISPYAANKAASEMLMKSFAQCYETDFVILRYFNVYGPRQDPSSPYSGVISKLCECVSKKQPFTIFGNGEQIRDYVYVKDVVAANISAATSPQRGGGISINIATETPTSVNDLVSTVEEVSGIILEKKRDAARDGDVLYSLADISLAKQFLHYFPQFPLIHGLEETLEWYKLQATSQF